MDISDLIHRVSLHFFDLADQNSNPLVVALALQDNSSVGLQHYSREFEELHSELREMLRSRVESSYQGFNESIGVYRQVVNSLKFGHEEVSSAEKVLDDLQKQLVERTPVLRELQGKSMLYKQKLDILNDLEQLQLLSQKFEQCISQKQFNQAKMLLGQSLETVTIRDLTKEPAIKPLLSYIQTQQSQLVGKIVEEIRAHVYLTSPYAQRRLEQKSNTSDVTSGSKQNSLLGADYLAFVNGLPNLPELEPEENIESNSYAYLTSLLKTLADLQSLDSSLEVLQRRVPHDLNSVIHSTTREVIRDLKITPESVHLERDTSSLLNQFRAIDQSAVSTLAKQILLKFTRFLETHFAISEIAQQCGVEYNFDHVCSCVANAVRSFALSYIGISNDRSLKMQSKSESRLNNNRNKQPIFQFGAADEDPKSLRDFETLRSTLQKSVPGLLADDPSHLFAETHKEEQLEVVAPSHILNIRPLLEPLTLFFSNVRDIANSKQSKDLFDNFLDQFLQQSFVPRLKDSFDEAVAQIANQESAFEEMPNWRSKSQIPIVNCAAQFSETLYLLSKLLDTGSTYREEYARILVSQLSRIAECFKNQLLNQFKNGVTVNSNNRTGMVASLGMTRSTGYLGNNNQSQKMKKIWELAVNPPLDSLLKKLFDGDTSQMGQEFNTYFSKRQFPNQPKPSFTLADIVSEDDLKPIALLITSIQWMVLRLKKMRKVSSTDANQSGTNNISSRVRRRWTLLDTSKSISLGTKNGDTYTDALTNATAILAGETLNNFDGIVNSLQSHAFYALCAIRVDIFMGTVCMFDQMIVNRDFSSRKRGEERDPVVDRMQVELSTASEIFDKYLLPINRQFILAGIPQFMDELFILEALNITEMNEAGQNQLLTNIFAIQQMLTSIVEDPRNVDFSRASGFMELMRLNPSLIIDKARERDTDLDLQDLKLLLEIRHRHAGPNMHMSGSLTAHIQQLEEIFNNMDKPESPVKEKPPTTQISSRRSVSPVKTSQASPSKQSLSHVKESAFMPSKAPHPELTAAPTPAVAAGISPRALASAANRQSQKQTSPVKARSSARDNNEPLKLEQDHNELIRKHEAEDAAEADRLFREREQLKAEREERERLERERQERERIQRIEREQAEREQIERERQRALLKAEQEQKRIEEEKEMQRIELQRKQELAEQQRKLAEQQEIRLQKEKELERLERQREQERAEQEEYRRHQQLEREAEERRIADMREQQRLMEHEEARQRILESRREDQQRRPSNHTIKPVTSHQARTSATPSSIPASSPLINHRSRFESARPTGQNVSQKVSIPNINDQNNGLQYPQTPDAPVARPRTPSERALEAARQVGNRQIQMPRRN